MLTLTDSATTEIRNIIDNPEAPQGCGVRIASDPAAGGLSLALAATPAEDDHVLEEAGARVFLEPGAAALLDDKALHAGRDDAGQVQFSVADVTG